MSNYYEIIGLNKLASTEEIIKQHALLKELNKLNEKIEEAFFVLTDYHRRKKYDSILEKKSLFSIFKIPFFGYDFDEKYVKNYNKNVVVNNKYGEIKRFKVDDKKFLVSEKQNINGKDTKIYYIETDGKKEMITEESINKIKSTYYDKTSSDKINRTESLNTMSKLLKDKLII
jgi:curved DNA-binding protein CbpA